MVYKSNPPQQLNILSETINLNDNLLFIHKMC